MLVYQRVDVCTWIVQLVYVDVHQPPIPFYIPGPKKYANLPDNQGLSKVKNGVQWTNKRNNTNMVWNDNCINYIIYIIFIHLYNYIFIYFIWYMVYNYIILYIII